MNADVLPKAEGINTDKKCREGLAKEVTSYRMCLVVQDSFGSNRTTVLHGPNTLNRNSLIQAHKYGFIHSFT